MTELETLERAKMYMEKLANGINPLDGTAIPDEDIVNNVRLSRCFFYVADILRQVIDSGGITPRKKRKKCLLLFRWKKDLRSNFLPPPFPSRKFPNESICLWITTTWLHCHIVPSTIGSSQ